MQISDTEFILARQRNQLVANAAADDADITLRDLTIIELRKALAIVKGQLATERAEKASLAIQLQRLRQRH